MTGLTVWQHKKIHELFDQGVKVPAIAKRMGRSETTIRGSLASRLLKRKSAEPMERPGSDLGMESYVRPQEAFAAGYRLALAHIKLHGMEVTHEHWWHVLTPWVRGGLDELPPAFLRMHMKKSP